MKHLGVRILIISEVSAVLFIAHHPSVLAELVSDPSTAQPRGSGVRASQDRRSPLMRIKRQEAIKMVKVIIIKAASIRSRPAMKQTDWSLVRYIIQKGSRFHKLFRWFLLSSGLCHSQDLGSMLPQESEGP